MASGEAPINDSSVSWALRSASHAIGVSRATTENAIKLFAARRKVMGTLFTQAGIRDYLLLLSLYQTLR